jgi:hypothetical protein
MFSTSELDYPKASIRSGAAGLPAVLHWSGADWGASCLALLTTLVPTGITERPLCRIRRPEHSHRLPSALPG